MQSVNGGVPMAEEETWFGTAVKVPCSATASGMLGGERHEAVAHRALNAVACRRQRVWSSCAQQAKACGMRDGDGEHGGEGE
jgi:hypothetical protein